MKKAFIIHGWEGYPEEGWFPWLKKQLEKKDFQVFVPQMPNTNTPIIKEWVGFLKERIKSPKENIYLIGHSIGCQTIMRYLETLTKDEKIGGVLFVAGFFNLKGLETDEERLIAKPWLKNPIDLNKVKQHCNKFVAIFSDDDPYVPLSDSEIFLKKLDAKIIILKNKGHMGKSENTLELPEALEALLKVVK